MPLTAVEEMLTAQATLLLFTAMTGPLFRECASEGSGAASVTFQTAEIA
jgi:hypothetical protein